MTALSLLGLAVAMFILAITPGPGVFATVSKAIASGFRQSIPVVLGIVLGDLIFLLFAIYGLSMIAQTFYALFTIIKILGAIYLLWLGIKIWRTSPSALAVTNMNAHSARLSFFGGLSITLGNPKVILFYLGFLPTFVDLTSLNTVDVALVALVVSAVLGGVMLFYAYTASQVSNLLKSGAARQRMNKAAGGIMIGTGLILLAKA